MSEPSGASPDLRFLAPAARENQWTDLLATLISTDPDPMSALLGIEFDDVEREKVVPGQTGRTADRLDLLLTRGGRQVAAVEVKVLSGLGHNQLERYLAAFPTAGVYRVLHLDGLPVNLHDGPPWKTLTWQYVLNEYTGSRCQWVATTARAWLSQIESLVPKVDEDTIWNDVPDDAACMELALRARVAWLSARMHSWCELPHDIAQSSGGGNWGVRMWTPSHVSGHVIAIELQEGMNASEWRPDPDQTYSNRLKGPSVLIGLRQDAVTTSADFDWTYLGRIFAEHIMGPKGEPRADFSWHTTSARPGDPTDKANWEAMIQAGAPRWLGRGWGMKATRSAKTCFFGARFSISPNSTLGQIDTELRRVQPLLLQMANR